MRRLVSAGLILAVLVTAALVVACNFRAPLRIGVLLPLSGPQDRDQDALLDWAAAGLNASGGVGGRRVELVYRDSAQGDIEALGRELADDPSIRVVIGPETSAQVYQVAPMFIERKKLLISPTSTSGDVFRAFGKRGFFWRTSQSDVAQVRTILHILASRKVKRLALIAEDGTYGKTFSDWTGFFAVERGMRLLGVTKLRAGKRDYSSVVNAALVGDPEYVVLAAFSEDAVEVKKELDRRHSRARLMLTDAAETGATLEGLGAAAEGLELVSPAADPDSGFETAFATRFGHLPADYLAPTYDAFFLAVCALARNEQRRAYEGLDASLAYVTEGDGARIAWDRIDEAVASILGGERPNLDGASNSLTFDREFGVDPLRTFYALNRVSSKDGMRDFRTVETLSSDESLGYGTLAAGASAGRTLPSEKYIGLESAVGAPRAFVSKKDSWAVVVAASKGWDNYRHQADALAVYDMLKSNGFQDDHIVLFSADDVPLSPQNARRGDVHNVVGGRNLRAGAVVDYAGGDVTVANVQNALLGEKSPATPAVLETDDQSNVLLYIVDHGAPGSISFQSDTVDLRLDAPRLAQIVDTMRRRRRFRQMLVVTEVCYGESMAAQIKTPGVLYLTGAGPNEETFATNYESDTGVWLADEFTYQTLQAVSREPTITIASLYRTVYERVAGSHVTIENQRNFGDVYTTQMSDFLGVRNGPRD